MRIRDWRVALLCLIAFGLIECCFADTQTPILAHEEPAIQREFQNAYQSINVKPSVSSGAGAPSKAPGKLGDIYISTTTAKVYIATATATSASWVVVN